MIGVVESLHAGRPYDRSQRTADRTQELTSLKRRPLAYRLGYRRIILNSADVRLPVQSQGQAECATAAPQERGERRHLDLVSALGKAAVQTPAAIGRNDGIAHADRVSGKVAGVLHRNLDQIRRSDAFMNLGEPLRREGGGNKHDLAAR